MNGPSPRRVLVDLLAGGVTSVVGADTAIDDTSYSIAKQPPSAPFGEPHRVLVVGKELRRLADESDAVSVLRIEDSLEVLRRLEANGRVGDGTKATLVAVSRDAYRSASAASLLAYQARRPWLCVVLPTAVATSRAIISSIGGEQRVYLCVSGYSSAPDLFSDSLDQVAVGLDPPVEVAVLGQIEVRGASGSLERRPKLTELVVYLAMHPEGATSSTWQNALWPDRRVPAQTVANRLSEAAGCSGSELDGRPRLRRSGRSALARGRDDGIGNSSGCSRLPARTGFVAART